MCHPFDSITAFDLLGILKINFYTVTLQILSFLTQPQSWLFQSLLWGERLAQTGSEQPFMFCMHWEDWISCTFRIHKTLILQNKKFAALYVCVWACVCIEYRYTYIYVCIYRYTHACVCVYIHIYTYERTHIYINGNSGQSFIKVYGNTQSSSYEKLPWNYRSIHQKICLWKVMIYLSKKKTNSQTFQRKACCHLTFPKELMVLLLFWAARLTSSWTRSSNHKRNSRASCWELPRNCDPYFDTIV